MVNSETSIQLSSIMSSNNNDAASAETNNVRNVRQRVNPSGLESLPDAPLANIASYLSHTTRALLSVALTAPSISYDLGGHNENEKDLMAADIEEVIRKHGWQSASSDSLSDILSSAIENCKITKINNNPQHQALSKASKIVLSNPYYRESFTGTTRGYGSARIPYDRNDKYKEDWKVLDLLDLDKSLRMRLTDGDIAGILVCIDAVNKLEQISLPHCINVRGDGLAPLSGSIVLKKADLCIVSEEVDSMTPKLSIDAVLPILDSIVAKNQDSMSRLHVPKVWRDTYSERLNNFYLENELLPQAGYKHMSQSEKRAKYLLDRPNWNHMRKCKMGCAECCSNFQFHSGKIYISCEGDKLEVCPEPNCGRKYCAGNHADYEIRNCVVCEKRKCRGCAELYNCECCDRDLCEDCVEQLICVDCGWSSNCVDCATDGSGNTRDCRQCQQSFCGGCQPDMDNLRVSYEKMQNGLCRMLFKFSISQW